MKITFEELVKNGKGPYPVSNYSTKTHGLHVISISPDRVQVEAHTYGIKSKEWVKKGQTLNYYQGELSILESFTERDGPLAKALRYWDIPNSKVSEDTTENIKYWWKWFESNMRDNPYGLHGSMCVGLETKNYIVAVDVYFFIENTKQKYRIQEIKLNASSDSWKAEAINSIMKKVESM